MNTSVEILEYLDLVQIRILFALIAIAISVILGIFTIKISGWIAQPALHKIMNFPFGLLFAKLDRKNRSANALKIRGAFILVIIALISFVVGAFCQSVTEGIYKIGYGQIVIFMLFIISSSSWAIVWNIYKQLKNNKKAKKAYYSVARSTRNDLNSVDDYGITRIAISFLPISFNKYMVTPAFWFILGGLKAVFIYSAISFMALSTGKEGFTKGFGRPSLYAEKIMGYIPEKISALFILIAIFFTPKAKFLDVFKLKDKSPYYEGGMPVSIFAGALGITLGGASKDIDGSSIQRKWVGNENLTAKISPEHIKRAIYMIVISFLVFVTSLLIISGIINLFH